MGGGANIDADYGAHRSKLRERQSSGRMNVLNVEVPKRELVATEGAES